MGLCCLVDDMVRYANPVAQALFRRLDLEGMKFEAFFQKSLSNGLKTLQRDQVRQGVAEWEVELPNGQADYAEVEVDHFRWPTRCSGEPV